MNNSVKRSSNHRSLLQKVDGSCESIREQGELAAEEPRQKRGRITGVTGFEWPRFFFGNQGGTAKAISSLA